MLAFLVTIPVSVSEEELLVKCDIISYNIKLTNHKSIVGIATDKLKHYFCISS